MRPKDDTNVPAVITLFFATMATVLQKFQLHTGVNSSLVMHNDTPSSNLTTVLNFAVF